MKNIIQKVLFVSTESLKANTSAAIRNKAFVEGLLHCGFCVHTVTPKRNRQEEINSCIVAHYLIKEEMEIDHLGTRIAESSNAVLFQAKRLISKCMLYDGNRRLLKYIRSFNIEDTFFDFVISSSDSKVSHLIVDRLIKKKKILYKKWIQYWGDPFYIDINKRNFLPRFIVQEEEKRLLNLADIIVYTSPRTLEVQQRLFNSSSEKMIFIPTPYEKERIYAKKKKKILTIGYYGDYRSQDRNIIPFYNVAKNMSDFNFEFVGRTDLTLKSFSNMRIYDRIPYNELLKFENDCDILVCVGNRAGCTQLPGKIYHYAATNKPILYIYEEYDANTEYLAGLDRYHLVKNQENEIRQKLLEISLITNKYCNPEFRFECKYVVGQLFKIVYCECKR